MDTAFRGLGRKSEYSFHKKTKQIIINISYLERMAKDSLLSQNSTASTATLPPPPMVSCSPTRPARIEKATKVVQKKSVQEHHESSSCSSPSSGSEDEAAASDVENEDPQPITIPSTNKRARADATSTESLSPPRTSNNNPSRMILRSSARKPQQTKQQAPVSTPSFRQQRKHRRIDLELTPLNKYN